MLERDGWAIESDGDAFFANNPDVADEPAARNRLDRLGLLTSARVRIEFER